MEMSYVVGGGSLALAQFLGVSAGSLLTSQTWKTPAILGWCPFPSDLWQLASCQGYWEGQEHDAGPARWTLSTSRHPQVSDRPGAARREAGAL